MKNKTRVEVHSSLAFQRRRVLHWFFSHVMNYIIINCSLKGETYITNLMLNVDNEKQVSIPEKVLSQKYISIIVVSLNCSGND